MSSKNKNLSSYKSTVVVDGSPFRIAIVVSEYNESITGALQEAAETTLKKHGVKEKNILVVSVPGAYELPLAAQWVYEKQFVDAVICLGCVIKGETSHDVYINQAVSDALMDLGLKTGAPFVFGVITPNNMKQAKERAGGKHGNKGVECAVAALRMLELKHSLKKK